MRTLLLFASIAFGASTGMATAIAITGGSADINSIGTSQFSLTGTGFSFTGNGSVSGGVCNFFPACPAGSSFPVDTSISSEDLGLSGNVNFGGSSFNYVGQPGSQTTAGLDFFYVLNIPAGGIPTLTLLSPFTSNGGFVSPTFNGGQPLTVSGQGTATLVLALISAPPGTPSTYSLQSAHYQFNTVPEPGTAPLMLIGIAAIGLIPIRRAKQSSIQSASPAPLQELHIVGEKLRN